MASRTPLLLRIGFVMFAALTCAWFALGVIQAQSISRASTLLGSPTGLAPRQVADVRSLLSSAATLNPDSLVDILRGELLETQGHAAAARRVYRSVVRGEPENVFGWDALAAAGDPSALSHIARLEPNVPAP